MNLTLLQAERIVTAALDAARTRKARPLAVMAVDSGGHPICFRREDGASLFRFDLSRAKALGALGFGMNTRELGVRAHANPGFFMSAAIVTQGGAVFSAGGVLIEDAQGQLIGAIGISGDSADTDEACAIAGILSAGLACRDAQP